MHELPITQGMLDLALEHACGQRVTDINCVVGELASVVDDCVEFYWEILSAGTHAAGAKLHFRRVPLQFECRDCNALFEPAGEDFACPVCAGPRVVVAAGDELRIESIDVVPAGNPAPVRERS